MVIGHRDADRPSQVMPPKPASSAAADRVGAVDPLSGAEFRVSDIESPEGVHSAVAMTSSEVFPPVPPVAVLREALAAGVPSYDAVIAEHVPLQPDGGSCRSCGFVYTDRPVCPAMILAAAGYPVLADRVRILPAAADPEAGARLLVVHADRHLP